MAGKTVAVEEALRGLRGVWVFTVKTADWEQSMCDRLGVRDFGMFEEVLRRVHDKLKKCPRNMTKYPILVLSSIVPEKQCVAVAAALDS